MAESKQYYIGVDVGGTSVKLGLFDGHHAVQISQCLMLFLQIYLLHQMDSCLTYIYCLRIIGTYAVYL